MQAIFEGQITELKCKAGITKLIIETDADKTKLDEIKRLLDTNVNISIANNQTTLTLEYPISEDENITITAEGQKLLEGAKEMLDQ